MIINNNHFPYLIRAFLYHITCNMRYIFFTKNIVSQIELNQLANIDKMIYLFIFVSGLYFMILSKIRFWDWPDIYNSYTKILHTYYMEKYFLLDNTSVEKI